GGLTSESRGLQIAHRQVNWWKSNKIYPIYFVWETGFFEIIGQLLRSGQSRMIESARGLSDFISDPLLEAVARRFGGVSIWSGMKRSAELSVAPGGGARYVARKLKEFCEANAEGVELHAMGHSAGAIFHAHFVPAALKMGAPSFRSMHFLAPAIRVDTFKELLAPKVGEGIDHLTIFTMKKDWELDDNCAELYRKSLLYLIHHGLEPQSKTPILGLEESLRNDGDLIRLFGLAGHSSASGEVIWSRTRVESGRNASTSTSHGGFDEDSPTMNSAARRVLGLDDTTPIEEFPKPSAGARAPHAWEDAADWEEELREMAPRAARVRPKQPASASPTAPVASAVPAGSKEARPDGHGGRRRALCVGINTYPTSPLSGCVADAEEWVGTLRSLGFETTVLINEQATYDSILTALADLVDTSRSGDVIAFQFAGHGTTLTDKNKDESVNGLPGRDEALCPYDFAKGAFIIDDDIAEVFSRIPEGVNVTCFIDCCHSGTITRFAVGDSAEGQGRARNERPRFIVATPEMENNHRAFQKSVGRSRSFVARGPDSMREVLFSACLQSEVAWENDGHGDFTTRATQILKQGAHAMSNELFQQKVVEAFGSAPRQHPELDCAASARGRTLLGLSTTPGAVDTGAAPQGAAAGAPSREIEAIAQGFRMIADALLKPR
ncbi:MAG TPA: caspase family protein, partial [Blastocatellia bacterium]|nr:caspase family protein [Blastocatellia bacterium]